MTLRACDVRESEILGHQLAVTPAEDGSWGVTVDGDLLEGRHLTAYSAWAHGAAESYRLGRIGRPPPRG